jgi:hypothetical protein
MPQSPGQYNNPYGNMGNAQVINPDGSTGIHMNPATGLPYEQNAIPANVAQQLPGMQQMPGLSPQQMQMGRRGYGMQSPYMQGMQMQQPWQQPWQQPFLGMGGVNGMQPPSQGYNPQGYMWSG